MYKHDHSTEIKKKKKLNKINLVWIFFNDLEARLSF